MTFWNYFSGALLFHPARENTGCGKTWQVLEIATVTYKRTDNEEGAVRERDEGERCRKEKRLLTFW